MATTNPSSALDLLRRYQPVARFDSHEAFFAHDVRAMAENPSFRLERGPTPPASANQVIASHDGAGGQLSLDFLTVTDGRYPSGEPYQAGDHFALSLKGPDAFADKIGDYRQMERELDRSVRNRIFGHAVQDGGDLWLQYWFFYLYNDAQFGGRVDLHEGDWEMVQFLLQSGEPVKAVYAQHAYAEMRDWEQVEQDPQFACPVVYPGRGSHASYFEPGLHRTHVHVDGTFLPLWWDVVDGAGPQIRQQLVVLDPAPGWAQWRGVWGGTQPRIPLLDGDSPTGPTSHGQWTRPAALEQSAIDHEVRPLTEAQRVSVRRSPPGLQIRFDFSDEVDPPDRLLVTCTTPGEPPLTDTLVVDSLLRGRVTTRRALDAIKGYTVDVSTISAAGVPASPSPDYTIALRRLRPVSPVWIVSALLWPFDRFWLWVGSRLRRRVPRTPVTIDASHEPGT